MILVKNATSRPANIKLALHMKKKLLIFLIDLPVLYVSDCQEECSSWTDLCQITASNLEALDNRFTVLRDSLSVLELNPLPFIALTNAEDEFY